MSTEKTVSEIMRQAQEFAAEQVPDHDVLAAAQEILDAYSKLVNAGDNGPKVMSAMEMSCATAIACVAHNPEHAMVLANNLMTRVMRALPQLPMQE